MSLIISSGMARSGTNVITKALSVNPSVMMTCGANIEIFRYFRNHLVFKYGDTIMKSRITYNSPLDDYFVEGIKQKLLYLILNSNFHEEFPEEWWGSFINDSCARADHDASDLLPHFYKLKGESFYKIILNLKQIIVDARACSEKSLIGMHESWNIEFFPALARADADAKFIIVIRDPRASISSMLRQAQDRPEIKAQIISYCRHFRKYVILSNLFKQMSLFENRLIVIKSEDFMCNPEEVLTKLSVFLGVEYCNSMADPVNYYDYASRSTWAGNSAYDNFISDINYTRTTRWKEYLSPEIVESIEFLCAKEMASMNYELNFDPQSHRFDLISQTITDNDYDSLVKWRTDVGDPVLDLGYELYRNKILNRSHDLDDLLIERLCLISGNWFKRINDLVESS